MNCFISNKLKLLTTRENYDKLDSKQRRSTDPLMIKATSIEVD